LSVIIIIIIIIIIKQVQYDWLGFMSF